LKSIIYYRLYFGALHLIVYQIYFYKYPFALHLCFSSRCSAPQYLSSSYEGCSKVQRTGIFWKNLWP